MARRVGVWFGTSTFRAPAACICAECIHRARDLVDAELRA